MIVLFTDLAPPERSRKLFLIGSIVATCTVLSLFKYFNFFNENIGYVSRCLVSPKKASRAAWSWSSKAASSSTSDFEGRPRRFFGKLLTFCFVIGALDLGVGIVLDHLYQGTQGGGVGVINRALKQRYEVVVIGDSRAHHHFDPAVLGQETGLGVYNAGVDGQSLLFFYGLEQLIVTEYSPKLILLHLGPGDLRGRQGALDRLSVLLPHAHHPEIRALLMQRSPYENIKLLSRIYPYNSMMG